jgi:transcriptional regulator with XRE-family HTH domain
MKVCDRLAELRRERGYTLRTLRDRIQERTSQQVSISYLSELEHGQSSPTTDLLEAIARSYDMSSADLLAPTDFVQGVTDAHLPPGLLELQGEIERDWLETLSRIEFRGQRPETAQEWRAIYGVLRVVIEPKLKS